MRSDRRRHAIAIVALVLVVIHSASCGRDTAAQFGFANDENLPATLTDVLCDAGAGSTCTAQTLAVTLNHVLIEAASRPGSIVRLWSMGSNVGETVIIGNAVSPMNRKRGKASRKRIQDHFVSGSTSALLKAIHPYLVIGCRRRSPIAESIARIIWAAPRTSTKRVIIVISDAREVSTFGDFECGVLPAPNAFVEKLHADQVLAPGSLSGIDVEFVYVSLGAVDGGRCQPTLARDAAVRSLWKAAVTSAGAASFHYETADAAASK